MSLGIGYDGAGAFKCFDGTVGVMCVRWEDAPEPFRSSDANVFPLCIIHGKTEAKSLQGIMELIGIEMHRMGPFGAGALVAMERARQDGTTFFENKLFTLYLPTLYGDTPARGLLLNTYGHSGNLGCSYCCFSSDKGWVGYSKKVPVGQVRARV